MVSSYPLISIVLLFALMTPYMITTHLWIKITEKHVFGNIYIHNLYDIHDKNPSIEKMVPRYCNVLPMVLVTLMTPYDYPMGHHDHSFVTKIGYNIIEKHVFGDF
jgi:hypothetical protein